MTLQESWDATTAAQLRERGGLKWTTGGPGSIGAFVAEMDFGTAPEIGAALAAAVGRGELGYLTPGRSRGLREAASAFYRTELGAEIPPQHVHEVADVLTALAFTITHLTSPGSPVIVPTPAYMPFLDLPPTLGREVIRVPLIPGPHGPTPDPAGIARAFAAGAELLILCNPSNPVGRVFTRGELEGVAAVVTAAGGRVFADEIWAPLIYSGHTHVPYAGLNEHTAAHTTTGYSASKAWNLPGLKTAQLITHNEADLAVWEKFGTFTALGASTLGVIAGITAYREGGPWLREALEYLDGNRAELGSLLAELLPEVGYSPPEGTYVAWLDLRGLDLPDPVAAWAADGVLLTDGAACGAPGFARLILALPRPLLREAVTRMAATVRRARAARTA